jgi:hypothetical protein
MEVEEPDHYHLDHHILEGTCFSPTFRAKIRMFVMEQASVLLTFRKTAILANTLVDLFIARGGKCEAAELKFVAIASLSLSGKLN